MRQRNVQKYKVISPTAEAKLGQARKRAKNSTFCQYFKVRVRVNPITSSKNNNGNLSNGFNPSPVAPSHIGLTIP